MTPKTPRGFALMSPEKRKEAQSRGGSNVTPERHVGFESLDKTRLREIAMKGVEARRRNSLTRAE